MLQLHKIYIENFKGVYRPSVVSFDEQQLTILNGPNGFGKTTIFDVVELCLRGRLQRTMTYNDVTKKNTAHKKPFYQNTRQEDVVLKIWLKNNEQDHIIIKRLDKNSDGKIGTQKAFRPDAWGILETYYSTDATHFDNTSAYLNLPQIEQSAIDQLFFDKDELSLANLYPLFNYLQQEDNIYFLRKDEDAKKNELTFLFQTQKEAREQDHVAEVLSMVASVRETLQARIVQLGQAAATGVNAVYTRLFPNKNLPFDVEEPFLSVPGDQLIAVREQYTQSLQQFIEFARVFDSSEFNKQKLKSQLRSVVDNPRLLQGIVAQYFLVEERALELRQRVIRNARYREYIEGLINFEIDDTIHSALGFDNTFVNALNEAIGRRQRLRQQIGDIGRIIRELNSARGNTMSHYAELNDFQPQTSNCPLCDAEWDGLNELEIAYNQKSESLNSFNRVQLTELDELEVFIRNNYFINIVNAIQNYLTASENVIDPDFAIQVYERRGNADAIGRFMVILNNAKIDITFLLINQPVSFGRLDENAEKIKLVLQSAIDNLAIDDSKLVNMEFYSHYFDEDERLLLTGDQLLQKQIYLNEKFNASRLFSLNVLTERGKKVEELEKRISAINRHFVAVIKEYKKKMIEKIKIPFYIYSGKILQHYQQGYGIFVDVKDSTSRVRFLTDESTDHDIIHQLSSGQLAVVSIAFCLALNKVYEAPQHFKFLAIDDPVQTLDDLNIHSFIELLRHEFSDYQLVISTHDDHVANYLTYKFDKFQFKVGRLNVQQAFYSSQFGTN